MKFTADMIDWKKIKASTLIRFCLKNPLGRDPFLKELDHSTGGILKRIFASEEFEGKLNQTIIIHAPETIPFERVVLVGLGDKPEDILDNYRQASGTVARLAAVKNSLRVAFFMAGMDDKETAQAVTEGYFLGGFEINDYKSNSEKDSKTTHISFVTDRKDRASSLKDGYNRGEIIAEGTILARRLAAEPANMLNPQTFTAKANALARKYHLHFQVLDEKQIQKEKMGALWAVAKGSVNSPRFVILRHDGGRAKGRPIVLVGKGITFDTGGISLKPAQDMHEMKQDMTGGAVVLSTLITAARLGIRQNIMALIPLAENMPSGIATRPGDIITSRKGKTIEIINTDAEGRLILADALDYADEFNPQAVLDIATLTGAAKYILGYAGAPIIGNNTDLIDGLYDAADNTGERVWELPIWERHREQMKSTLADLKNSAGPYAGTIAAAAFLENFIGDWPWAHIDIAYVDLEPEGQPYVPKGATGFGVRLLTSLLVHWKKV